MLAVKAGHMKLLVTSAALVAIWAAPAVSGAQTLPPQGPPVIVVTGEGVVKQAPDRAWVQIAAENRARTAAEAQRVNVDAMTAVIDKIKATGIPQDAIQTSGYNLQPEFDYSNGKRNLRDYVARNSVRVRVDALPSLGTLITAVVGTGATEVNDVRFDLKNRGAAEREALRLAVEDARHRADAAAAGAGVTIDRVLRIQEQRQGEVVRPMMSNARLSTMSEAGAAAPTPIEAGDIELHASVTLTASIK
jgi:uncharacterized protein YggE